MSSDALAEKLAEVVNETIRAALLVELPKMVAGIVGSAVAQRPLVDIHAIAQFFGVSVVTVRRMVGEGMPVEWVASAMRFDIEACREWNRDRGKRSVTKDAGDRKRSAAGQVSGVTFKSRSR